MDDQNDSLLGRARSWTNEDSGYESQADIAMKGGHEQITSKIGPVWATVHMLKAFIGTAILALPFSFKLAGFLGGMLLVVLISAAIFVGMQWVVEAKHIVEKLVKEEDPSSVDEDQNENDPESNSSIPAWRRRALDKIREANRDVIFSDMGAVAFGKFGEVAVNVCLVSLQLGIVVVYIIFVGKNFANVLCKFSDSEFCWGTSSLDLKRAVHAGHSHNYYSHLPFQIMVAIATFSLVPLVLLANLKKLRYASLAAICATAYAVVYVLWIQSSILIFEEQHHEVPTMDLGGSMTNTLLFFGIMVYAMEGIGLALPIEASMQNRAHYPKVALITVLITTSLYLPIGVLGYLAFANHTQDIVLLNFPPSHWTSVLQVTLCISLIFTAPLQGLPAFQITERAIFGFSAADHPVDGTEERTFVPLRHGCFRTGMVLLAGVTAMYLPFFHVVIGLLGSFCCSCLALTFPAAFVFILGKKHSFTKKLSLWLIMILGLFVMVAGTGAILWAEVINSSSVHTHSATPVPIAAPLATVLKKAAQISLQASKV